jgi:hypothetical protein
VAQRYREIVATWGTEWAADDGVDRSVRARA